MATQHQRRTEEPVDHLRAPIERIIDIESMSGVAIEAGAVEVATTGADSR